MVFICFLILFWFFSQLKTLLFWLYLWQLKEYRIDRFLAHFDTYKGKRIFLNFIFGTKLFLFCTLFFYQRLYFIIFAIYFLETTRIIFNIFRKTLILPVFTKKIIFLGIFNIFFIFFFLFLTFFPSLSKHFLILLLIFDLFYPVLISFSVFLFQPFVSFYKLWIAKKASEKREKMKELIVIGITGSFGKSSTKEFLATILSSKFRVLKTKKNQNNEFSIAKCILEELKPEHQVFVCEIGAYRKGEVERVARIIKPKIAIITGLNEQHLALFGNMENLISAEGGIELVEFLLRDGVLILNGENEILKKIYKNLDKEKKLVALNNELVDFWATDISIKKENISFFVKNKEGELAKFDLHLIGGQNIINLLLATCAAKIVGKMKLREIALACRNIKQEQTGVKLLKTKYGFSLIDASYSTNPDAVIAHLDYLKIWEKKKIIIMPCLIELGGAAREIHSKIGKKIKEVCDLAIITTFDYFKEIKEKAKEKAIFLEAPELIFKKLIEFCGKGDVILLEGRLPKKLLKLLSKV